MFLHVPVYTKFVSLGVRATEGWMYRYPFPFNASLAWPTFYSTRQAPMRLKQRLLHLHLTKRRFRQSRIISRVSFLPDIHVRSAFNVHCVQCRFIDSRGCRHDPRGSVERAFIIFPLHARVEKKKKRKTGGNKAITGETQNMYHDNYILIKRIYRLRNCRIISRVGSHRDFT